MHSDCEVVWSNCLQFIREQINEQSFKTWFKPIVPKKLENNTLTIQVPSQFFYEWLEEHYLSLLQRVIHRELGAQGKLEYSIIVDQGSTHQSRLPLNYLCTPMAITSNTTRRLMNLSLKIHLHLKI